MSGSKKQELIRTLYNKCEEADLNKALVTSAAGVVSLQRGKSPQTANDEGNLRKGRF